MAKKRVGSQGYQMMKALQGVFKPGTSRHHAKRYHLEQGVITSISTMRCMTADVFQFAAFLKAEYPEVRLLSEVTPGMAMVYIAKLDDQGHSGGWIGRVAASLRKLDTACRQAGIFPPEAPMLLPYKAQGGPGGYHSKPNPIPYTLEQAQAILDWIQERDLEVTRLLRVMWWVGLRVTEAVYLRQQDIDLEQREVRLNQESNANRTKGGRPRVVRYAPEHQEFMAALKQEPGDRGTRHLFVDRRGLADRAREKVRQACQELVIVCLGTHAFRKAFSVAQYHQARKDGASDQQALLETSRQLGHNRVKVTQQSYVPPQERIEAK